jgi:hypothetical protein
MGALIDRRDVPDAGDRILGIAWRVLVRWQELAHVNTEWAEALLGEVRGDVPAGTGTARELCRVGAEIGTEAEWIRRLATGHDRYRALLADIIGADPTGEVAAVVTGDWAALTIEASTLATTADAFDATRRTVDERRTPDDAWLAAYSAACGRHAEFLRRAASEILRLAREVLDLYRTLRGALGTAVDTLVDALVTPPARGADDYRRFGSVVLAFTEVSEIADDIRALVYSFADLAEPVAGLGDAVTALWPAKPHAPTES